MLPEIYAQLNRFDITDIDACAIRSVLDYGYFNRTNVQDRV
ncbi:MAG TPA: hypothetical protein VJV79_30595 [Polyangiaceae bacterium]|nr:hypothetical protein [Polyangiaceae bacterium]